MTDRILFVEPRSELRPQTERALEGLGDVEFVAGGTEVLAALEQDGPYAVLVCDYQGTAPSGRELLARARVLAPETVTIVQSKRVEVDVVIEALHAGRIFRFLERPAPLGRVREAVEAALSEHRLLSEARSRVDRLDFSSRALAEFNGRLAQRVDEQTAALAHWQRFATELNACRALDEIARVTGTAVSELLPERGVFIELWNGSHQGQRCHFVTGPALADRRHVQAIVTPEGQVGSLVVASRDGTGQALSKAQRALLASLAGSCAVATHNQIRRLERDEAQQAAILALAKLAEQRDNETGKHLERVSRYCKRIAEGLRADGFYVETLSDAWITDLVRSAPLHDIGKVGIPDRILLKPGKLDPREWEIMKTHAELGARTLESVINCQEHAGSFLEMSMRIAWCHHEKWDGSGYPRGLVGEEIPLEARILALADVYDALTSRRPYKEPWTHAEAMKWVAEAAGAHFDPPLVRVFVRQHREIDAIRESLADNADDLARLQALVA